MKKIFVISLVVGLVLITGCSVRLSEYDKKSDYYNTVYRGKDTHNFVVLNNKLDKVLENQELIIKQNKKILKALKLNSSLPEEQ